MRIEVIGPAPRLIERIRAYAEYRVFSRLAPLARDVTTVRVVVSQSPADGLTSCSLSADLGPGGCVRTRSRRAHPTRAIDSAAEKLSAATARRVKEFTG
jgi:ribosome-associated translation inhibitor RaiA